MSIKNLKLNGTNEEGENVLTTGLDFAQILNNNADELGTETKLNLDTNNTPEHIAKALREQTEINTVEQKIGYQSMGGPEDLRIYEGDQSNSPSEMKPGFPEIYNVEVNTEVTSEPEPEPEPAEPETIEDPVPDFEVTE